ncbi:MAG: hypothetical protein LBD94_00455 [Rickettsiales bacterium]|nr:hypothetical protein [Rickettsiales bacterium]
MNYKIDNVCYNTMLYSDPDKFQMYVTWKESVKIFGKEFVFNKKKMFSDIIAAFDFYRKRKQQKLRVYRFHWITK